MGRPKGGRDKSKLALEEAIQKHVRERFKGLYDEDGYHPIVEMALLGANRNLSVEVRMAANKEVAGYLYHKLKAVEVRGNGDQPLQVQVVRFGDAIAHNAGEVGKQIEGVIVEAAADDEGEEEEDNA